MALTVAFAQERQTLPSWIDGFLEYTSKKQSPERFRRWAAITVIAAAIEQKVWLKTATGDVYPNLFTILIGLSGSGKGVALNASVDILSELITEYGPHIAPTSMSSASMTDALSDSLCKVLRPTENPAYTEYHSLFIPSRELGVLLPNYDPSFMNTLTDIYDGKPYRQTRRTKGVNLIIPRPQINILAATTPAFLNKFLPQGAWAEGFISRVILIYSGGIKPQSLFDDSNGDDRLLRNLISDLKVIGKKFGKIGFSEDAAIAINEWHLSGGEPIPDHPKLLSYNERRTFHLLKLCIIATLTRANNRFEIEMLDLEQAQAWLLEAEEAMPDIFRAMRGTSDNDVMEHCWHYVWQTTAKEKQPLSEERLWFYLKEYLPTHVVERTIQVMVKSGVLIAKHGPTSISYLPAEKMKR